FDDNSGVPVVGQIAERRMVLHPERVVYGSKRFIGRPLTKALADDVSSHMRYEIVGDAQGMAAVRICGRTLSPIEVGACILVELRKVAEAEMHREVNFAVITVPAAFTENQRQAVREAGARAGLTVLRIVSEPTAATLAYGYGRTEKKTVLVYDLGGGTFDVSILRLSGSTFTVLGSAGDTFLGGLDFDQLLAGDIYKDLKRQFPRAQIDRLGEERLMGAARDAKHQLSTLTETEVHIPMLNIGPEVRPIEFKCMLTRKQLETLSIPLLDRTIDRCDEALRMAGLKERQIEDVLLVGGQTRMPLIHQRLHQKFQRPPSKRVHPDEVVAIGAAVLATSFKGGDAPVLIDVLPLAIGIGQPDGTMKVVLERNAALPAVGTTNILSPNGRALEVTVFQGEQPQAWDNECLGSFLTAGARAATGPANLKIEFRLDNEGLLTVTSEVEGAPQIAQVVQRLTTQMTTDDMLSRLGAERIVPRPAIERMPAPTTTDPNAPGAPRKSFFEKFSEGFFGWFKRKKK
ncbi:MAG: Hsp70 family protein, partial [Polyangiales bacterium]